MMETTIDKDAEVEAANLYLTLLVNLMVELHPRFDHFRLSAEETSLPVNVHSTVYKNIHPRVLIFQC